MTRTPEMLSYLFLTFLLIWWMCFPKGPVDAPISAGACIGVSIIVVAYMLLFRRMVWWGIVVLIATALHCWAVWKLAPFWLGR